MDALAFGTNKYLFCHKNRCYRENFTILKAFLNAVQIQARGLFFLFILAILVMIKPAYAAGTITVPSQIPAPTVYTTGNRISTERLTPQASCAAFAAWASAAYNSNYTNPIAINAGACQITTPAGYTNITQIRGAQTYYYCDPQHWQYTGYGMGYDTSVAMGGDGLFCILSNAALVVPNSTCSGPTCTCNAGYKPNPLATACVIDKGQLESGFYPVMTRGAKAATELKWCEKGDAWKFGTTKNPSTRYSQSYLDNVGENGVQYSPEFSGPLSEALKLENMKINNYLQQTGVLPAGNKIIR